jgi:SHS2 domain-containing protein
VSKPPCPSDHPKRPPAGFELLEHPGDIKLRVWATSLGQLFAYAAQGMMSYLFGAEIGQIRAEPREVVQVEAPDREALLVDWLSELLYRAASEHHAYVDFRIDEVGDRRLSATAGIAPADAVDDIKGVTHHELAIREREGGWEATVVFDI